MKRENLTPLFVYGTLRRGFGNYHLIKKSVFLGTAKTKEKYLMVASGIPYVISNIPETQIIGEVYLVDNDILEVLDWLEKHPTFYERRKIVVILDDTNEEIEAWIYFNDTINPEEHKIVETGDYTDYRDLAIKEV